MACTRPGKVYFREKLTGRARYVTVPCRKCLACRMQRSNEWTERMKNHLLYHHPALFITLTYNDDYLPYDKNGNPTLYKKDMTNFWKAIRKRCNPSSLTYYYCGQYGGKLDRPHYHAVLFGMSFNDTDSFFVGISSKGSRIYRSRLFEKVWNKGNVQCGPATVKSMNYVARYIMDDRNEGYGLQKPYAHMSVGLGKEFALAHADKYARRDVLGVMKVRPRYYLRKLGIKPDYDRNEVKDILLENHYFKVNGMTSVQYKDACKKSCEHSERMLITRKNMKMMSSK